MKVNIIYNYKFIIACDYTNTFDVNTFKGKMLCCTETGNMKQDFQKTKKRNGRKCVNIKNIGVNL